MRLIFWQNVLSIHQEALLKELAKQVEVWLIYEEELSESRKAMGWEVPKFDGVKLVSIHDIHCDINDLLQKIDHDYHIFSGINAYPKISKYFNAFYQKNPDRILCFLEKPGELSFGIKNYLRFLKYKYYAVKYKNLRNILTPGGEKYLLKVGFDQEKIIPFGYFGPKNNEVEIKVVNSMSTKIRFIYVGSLSKRKNVSLVIDSFKYFKGKSWHLDIIGDGEERNSIEKKVDDFSLVEHVTLHGWKSNEVVKRNFVSTDYLILPSLHDGWGYVVNEALSNGCNVICTDACGVSSVIKDCNNSYVVASNSIKELTDILNNVIDYGPMSIDAKKETRYFFDNNLSGEAGAKMLMETLK